MTATLLERRNAWLRRASQPLPGSRPYDNCRPINIPARLDGRTLIDCVCDMHPPVERQQWDEWFRRDHILCDGEPVRGDRVVRGGEQFWHLFPDTVEPDVDGNVEITWEDDALIAVSKPAPLPVHPCGRFNRNTLTSLLDSVYGPGELRLVHRLDANTTGVMLLARSQDAATSLSQQFANNLVEKHYLVRIAGQPREDRLEYQQKISRDRTAAGVRVIDPAGLEARTEFRVLARGNDGTSLVHAIPYTGRTNQIRIHLWSLGYPVLGDPSYLAGQRIGAIQTLSMLSPKMCLHAWSLKLVHPDRGHKMTMTADAPVWVHSFHESLPSPDGLT